MRLSWRLLEHDSPVGKLLLLMIFLFPVFAVGQGVGQDLQAINETKARLAQATTPAAMLDAYSDLAELLRYRKDSSESLEVTRAYLALSIAEADGKSEMHALKMFGDIYEHHGRIAESISFQERSLAKAKEMRDTAFISLCLGDLGYTHRNLYDLETAYAYQREAMRFAEATKDYYRLSWLYVTHAYLLIDIDDVEGARQALEEGCAIAIEHEGEDGEYYCAGAKITFYCHSTKEYDKALPLLRERVNSLSKDSHPIDLAGAWCDMSICFEGLGQGDSAVIYGKQAIELWKSVGQNWSIPAAYVLLSSAYRKSGKTQEAIACLDSVQNYRDQFFSTEFSYDLYEALHLAYLQANDTATAYQFLKLQNQYSDSIKNDQLNKRIVQAHVKFDSERKRAQLARQELVIEQQNETDQQKTIILIVVALGLTVTVVLMIVIFRGNKRLKSSYQQLSEQAEEIKARDAEKAVLLREIHHRVKNNLQVISSLLSIQSRNIEDEIAANAVREGQNRVNSIALIHQKLYQTDDLSEVLLEDYLSQLTPPLKAAFGKTEVDVKVKLSPPNLALDIDTAIPLGLIINELLTNSFKYGFRPGENGSVRVEVTELNQDRFRLKIADDGPGLPEGFDWKKSRTMGLRLVRELTKQLRGKIEYNYSDGAEFIIEFQSTIARKAIA